MAARRPPSKSASKPAAKSAAARDAEPAPKKKAAEAAPAAKAAMAVDAEGLQSNLRNAAATTLEQGRKAFGRMKDASDEAAQSLEQTFAATSKGAVELATKALDAVKTNANATFDHLKALSSAKTLTDAIALHGQFIRKQSEVAVAQAKEFADLAKKTATETAAPIQAQLKKPLFPRS